MSHSVRLFIRDGQQLDLHVEEIPEAHCRFDIKPDPAGDDRVVVDLTIHGRAEPHHAESEVDDAVDQPASEKEVAEHDGDVVGVRKLHGAVLGGHRQSFQNVADLSRQFAGVQQGQVFNQPYVSVNQISPKAKESSGGDK